MLSIEQIEEYKLYRKVMMTGNPCGLPKPEWLDPGIDYVAVIIQQLLTHLYEKQVITPEHEL